MWQSIQVAGVLLTEAIELHFVFSVALVFHSYRDTNVLARKNCSRPVEAELLPRSSCFLVSKAKGFVKWKDVAFIGYL